MIQAMAKREARRVRRTTRRAMIVFVNRERRRAQRVRPAAVGCTARPLVKGAARNWKRDLSAL